MPLPPDTSSSTVTTTSKPSAFPSALRNKLSTIQNLTSDDIQGEAVIRKTCPECGREEVRYHSQQLRGADEGSTIFYTCDCGHRYARSEETVFLLLVLLVVRSLPALRC